jgi:hypothetical protein
MKWISIKDRLPKESDGLILVENGKGLIEIVYFSDSEEEIMKPWRFDKYDNPILHISQVKYWMPLPEPPK